jgi:hypothetical protein
MAVPWKVFPLQGTNEIQLHDVVTCDNSLCNSFPRSRTRRQIFTLTNGMGNRLPFIAQIQLNLRYNFSSTIHNFPLAYEY